MKIKQMAPLVVLLALAALPSRPAAAADVVQTAPTTAPPTLRVDVKSDQISLSDLRDVGLCLMQIKQQAINIYLEVTRESIPDKADPTIMDPDKITDADISHHSKYLPTRPEWLTFYINTMEPIIHLFKEDVKDAETGVEKIIVPKESKEKFEKLFDQYETSVQQLNEHITNIYDAISLPDNNIKIAKEACKIFQVAENLEQGRREAFLIIQKTSSNAELEQIIPKKKTTGE